MQELLFESDFLFHLEQPLCHSKVFQITSCKDKNTLKKQGV